MLNRLSCCNIIILGKPGAGKGTLSKILENKYGHLHIGAGDICRIISEENTDRGLQMRKFLANWYVPNDILFSLINEIIMPNTAKNKLFILDSIPRERAQLPYVLEIIKQQYKLGSNTIAIAIDISDEEILSRLLNRRTCVRCSRNYNLITCPPKKEGKCDKCNLNLLIREEDNIKDLNT